MTESNFLASRCVRYVLGFVVVSSITILTLVVFWYVYLLQVGPSGKVVGIDHVPELVQKSIDNVSKAHKHILDDGRLQLVGKCII